jgi:hypothetical protein
MGTNGLEMVLMARGDNKGFQEEATTTGRRETHDGIANG